MGIFMKILRMSGALGNQMIKYAVYLGLKKRFPNERIVIDDRSYEFDKYSGPVKLKNIFGIEYDRYDDYLDGEEEKERNKIFQELNSMKDPGYRHFELIGTHMNRIHYKVYEQYGANQKGPVSNRQYEFDKSLAPLRNMINNSNLGNSRIVFQVKKVYRKIKRYTDVDFIYVDSKKCQNANYISEIFVPKENAYYYCHWEQYDYWFRNVGETILRDIYRFPEFNNPLDIELSNRILNRDSVAIHVRRSEAVDRNKDLFDNNFYSKSVNYLRNYITNPIFLVFSFDMDWCRKNLETLGLGNSDEVVFVDWNKDQDFSGDKAVRDMQLMSMCTHNIIANSTFSFMGGYLNSNPNKIVCCSKDFGTEKFVCIK